jgi:hypothetical protein
MNNSCILNTVYYLELFVTDINGNPITGLITNYTIYKSVDDSIVNSGSLIDVGNGVYKASYTFTALGQYYIIYNVPSGYTDEVEMIFVVQDYAKDVDLARVLGLSDENKKILNTVYDANGNLLSALVKLYSSATDFTNDTNVLATYDFSATYDMNDLMITMGVKRTL